MLRMKGRSGKRFCGRSSKSVTSVRTASFSHRGDAKIYQRESTNVQRLIGSRYVYELYYEKEAISKALYDWLLKNGYADANLIAKWKKQGYEKVGKYAWRIGL